MFSGPGEGSRRSLRPIFFRGQRADQGRADEARRGIHQVTLLNPERLFEADSQAPADSE
jgi:hypothetical protein